MKVIAMIVAAAAAVSAMPPLMIANRQVEDYTQVKQTVCHDSACSKSCQSTAFDIGKCVPDSNGGFIMTCSDDGSTFNQTQFSDQGCSTQTRVVPGQTGQCYNAGVLTFVEFTCE